MSDREALAARDAKAEGLYLLHMQRERERYERGEFGQPGSLTHMIFAGAGHEPRPFSTLDEETQDVWRKRVDEVEGVSPP